MTWFQRLLRRWFFKDLRQQYVVIYDVVPDHLEDLDELYYGYFSSIEEAERLFFAMQGDHRYHNVKICLVVKDVIQ